MSNLIISHPEIRANPKQYDVYVYLLCIHNKNDCNLDFADV